MELSGMRNEKVLRKLVTTLSSNPLTAKQIAKKTGFSKPATYRHLQLLKKCGIKLSKMSTRREGKSGPKAVVFAIAKRPTAATKKATKKSPEKKSQRKGRR